MTTASVRRAASLVGFGVVSLLLVLAGRRLDVARVMTELHTGRVGWLALALVSYAAILPLWALQWRILAPRTRDTSFAIMLGVVAMTSSLLNTTALLLGEAAGVVLLVTRAGLARSAALSVLAMDQLLVGIAKIVVLATAALTLTLPPWMARGVLALVVGVSSLLALTLAAAWRHDAIVTQWAGRVPERLLAALRNSGRALAPLRSPSRGSAALALALLKKCAEVIAILCVQRAFGIELPIASAVLVLAALNLATLVPIVPGNIGVYEAAVAVIYVRLGVPLERAVGLAVVQHACYFVALALPGYLWLARFRPSRSTVAAS